MKKKIIFYNSIISIIIFIGCIETANSQQWESLGLSDLIIHSIAIDPDNPEIIYAGASRSEIGVFGLFKTFDGGVHWDTLFNKSMDKLIINPKNTNILYGAAGWLYKSLDAGVHWTRSDSGIDYICLAVILSLAIDPIHTDTLYAGTGMFDHPGPFKTINGGSSWFSIKGAQQGWNSIMAIAIDKNNPKAIYLGTDWSGDVLKSINGGESWERIFTKQNGGGGVYSICVDPDQSNIVYLGGAFHLGHDTVRTFYKSSDYGNNWCLADSGLQRNVVREIQINPENTNTIYAATGNGIFKSTDYGNFWKILDTAGLESIAIHSLVLHPKESNIIYAGTTKGIYKYHDVTNVEIPTSDQIICKNSNLSYNYPNPFNSETVIYYTISKPTKISLTIYNITGQLIKTFRDIESRSGSVMVTWNGKDNLNREVPSGIYLYRLQSDLFSDVTKMILIR